MAPPAKEPFNLVSPGPITASRHPDAIPVNGGTYYLFASLDTAIRQSLAELPFGSRQMKKTKAKLAFLVQKALLCRPFLQDGAALLAPSIEQNRRACVINYWFARHQ